MQNEYDDLLEKRKQLESLENLVAKAEAEAKAEAARCHEFEETHHAYTTQVERTRELKKEHAALTDRLTHATESALTVEGMPADTKAMLIQQAELLMEQHDMSTTSLKAAEQKERDLHQELMKLRLQAEQAGSSDVTPTKEIDEVAKKALAEEALKYAKKEDEKKQQRAKLAAAAEAVEKAQKEELALKQAAEEEERKAKLAEELALKQARENHAKQLQEEEAIKKAAEEKKRQEKLAEELALKKARDDLAKKEAEAKEQQDMLLALKKSTEDAAKRLQEEALKKEEQDKQQKLLVDEAFKKASEDRVNNERTADAELQKILEEERKTHENDKDTVLKRQEELLLKANIERDLKLQEAAAQKRLEQEKEKERYRKECAGHKPDEDDMVTQLMHTMKISKTDAEGLVALQKIQKANQQPVAKAPAPTSAEIPEEIKAEIDRENAKRKAEILDLEKKMAKARKNLEILRQREAEFRLRSGNKQATPVTETTKDDKEDEKTNRAGAESRPLVQNSCLCMCFKVYHACICDICGCFFLQTSRIYAEVSQHSGRTSEWSGWCW